MELLLTVTFGVLILSGLGAMWVVASLDEKKPVSRLSPEEEKRFDLFMEASNVQD